MWHTKQNYRGKLNSEKIQPEKSISFSARRKKNEVPGTDNIIKAEPECRIDCKKKIT